MEEKTELQKREVSRLSNEETNRITRECIQSALVLLMSEKAFDKITITEIVKRSGVSRTAFYRNFSSKEDVLSDLSEQILGEITALVMKAIHEEDPHQMYCSMFQIVKDHSRDFDVMLKAGLQRDEYLNVSAYIKKRYAGLDIMTRYAILAWWGAIQNMMQVWYRQGMRESSSDMADLCCRLFENVSSVFKNQEKEQK